MTRRDEDVRREAASQALQVAVDGPAGSGKSTLGRALAERLGSAYLDTGLMYRAVTWLALQSGIPTDDESAIADVAAQTSFSLDGNGETLVVNGEPAGSDLRGAAVDRAVSLVSAHPKVREEMVRRQRSVVDGRAIVVVGRDIGTVVLPHSPVKLWVTASAKERARRRLAEALPGSRQTSLAEMEAKLRDRDALDAGRAVSPLRCAPDATTIDTDLLSPDQALEAALSAVSHALETGGPDRATRAPGRTKDE